jgi:GNAT superfamily N-acetyltransferase
MEAASFGSEPSIDPTKLQVTPFKETLDVKSFICGTKELDDFLTTDEVKSYEEKGYGRTHLVYYLGHLVAYFTISNDSLRYDYLKKRRRFTLEPKKIVDAYPAVKIGRLATAKAWQKKGIGRYLIAYIAKIAIESGAKSGVRLLIVETKPESIEFYEKCGFELTFETKREKRKINRTMFLDLQSLRPLVPEKPP